MNTFKKIVEFFIYAAAVIVFLLILNALYQSNSNPDSGTGTLFPLLLGGLYKPFSTTQRIKVMSHYANAGTSPEQRQQNSLVERAATFLLRVMIIAGLILLSLSIGGAFGE